MEYSMGCFQSHIQCYESKWYFVYISIQKPEVITTVIITLLISITMLCWIGRYPGIYYGICLVPHNIVMDVNNVMPLGHNNYINILQNLHLKVEGIRYGHVLHDCYFGIFVKCHLRYFVTPFFFLLLNATHAPNLKPGRI